MKLTVTVRDPYDAVPPEEVPVVLWVLGKRGERSYYTRSLFAVGHRVRHRLTGPRRGCSCTRCFKHPRRRVPNAEVVEDRVRLAKLEQACRKAGIHIPMP